MSDSSNIEVPRWLVLKGEIDYQYFILGRLIESATNRTVLEQMVDKATGYDDDKFEQVKEVVAEIKKLRAEYDTEVSGLTYEPPTSKRASQTSPKDSLGDVYKPPLDTEGQIDEIRTYGEIKASKDQLDRTAVYINGLSPHNLWKAKQALTNLITEAERHFN